MNREQIVDIGEQGVINTPVGMVRVVATQRGIIELKYLGENQLSSLGVQETDNHLKIDQLSTEFRQYFAGRRKTFDLAIDWEGLALTPFTESVLRAALDIPYGKSTTYAQLAKKVGVPDGPRAVGNALGSNPLPIIIPCHRIIRSDGSRGGYTGGLAIKDQLLDLERSSEAT